MSKTIISVSGLRGVIGESLDPILAIRYVTAFLSTIDVAGPVVVGRDGRASGIVLADAICSGIRSCGREVLHADVAATPTVGRLIVAHNAACGIQISASHNPAPYNGIKLFGPDGRVVSASQGQQVLDAYHSENSDWCAHEELGDLKRLEDTTTAHLNEVLATIDSEAIRNQRFKVVLDSNRGAGSILGRKLLDALGCDFQILGDVPDGQFEHVPEPTEKNLARTTEQARKFQADAVFCQDPDADRLAIIDESGRYIGEEFTLAITAKHVLSATPGPVVVNCSTSRMTADIAEQLNCDFHVSAVGEANVTEKMMSVGAVFGGEGNGGPIDPRVGYVRDSFVAMALVLDTMAASGKTISELVADIPQYQIFKTTIPVQSDQVPLLLDQLQSEFADAEPNRLDGLRLDWPDRWLLVRPSNTEPIVRAIAEAKTAATAKELCEKAAALAADLGTESAGQGNGD